MKPWSSVSSSVKWEHGANISKTKYRHKLIRNKHHLWDPGFDPWVGKIPWRRKWQPTPVILPRESHGQRSLEGYSPRGCKELDMTEQLTLLCPVPETKWCHGFRKADSGLALCGPWSMFDLLLVSANSVSLAQSHAHLLPYCQFLLLFLFSHSVVSNCLRPHGLQHARLPCPSLFLGLCSNSCPLSHDAIQPSHSLSLPSPPAFNLSQHWGLF